MYLSILDTVKMWNETLRRNIENHKLEMEEGEPPPPGMQFHRGAKIGKK